MNRLDPNPDVMEYCMQHKNCIVIDVYLEYNEETKILDTAYDGQIYFGERNDFPPCVHEFLGSFCDLFADATQATDFAMLKQILNAATDIGFFVMYPGGVDNAMMIDENVKLANACAAGEPC